MLRRALKSAETAYRKSQGLAHYGDASSEALLRRDTNVLVFIRRRLAMCARRLGRLKEAVSPLLPTSP